MPMQIMSVRYDNNLKQKELLADGAVSLTVLQGPGLSGSITGCKSVLHQVRMANNIGVYCR